jgi:chemotaxis protein MotB
MLIGKHERKHDEEIWLVSYADMMTLLFGFFVILYTLSKVDEKKFAQIGKQLAEAFGGEIQKVEPTQNIVQGEARRLRALQLLVTMLNLGDNVDKAVRKIEEESQAAKNLEAVKDMINDQVKKKGPGTFNIPLDTSVKSDRIEIVMPDGLLFESGTATLMPKAVEGLKRVATYLTKVNGLLGIEVVGHTDSQVPAATSLFPNNWSLSAARAGAVANELIKDGLETKNITTSGMADLQPLFPERGPEGNLIFENMTKNRRVVIVVKKAHHGGEEEEQ